jgi:hypothetical protein
VTIGDGDAVTVGDGVVTITVGAAVGVGVGVGDGERDCVGEGDAVGGGAVVGAAVGVGVGAVVGAVDATGEAVGVSVGDAVGARVGDRVGDAITTGDGVGVGAPGNGEKSATSGVPLTVGCGDGEPEGSTILIGEFCKMLSAPIPLAVSVPFGPDWTSIWLPNFAPGWPVPPTAKLKERLPTPSIAEAVAVNAPPGSMDTITIL